uniref:Uncharacterized protein n=1 Tax=Tanacetum cinerariifolium TaxID=118510 RepID=A0A699H3P5_TANCI|nr:hypothetical protein [Tanacetum cinerariifolium]
MAWNTGSLSHALCASPMDPLFMETLLEHNIKSDGVQFWTAGMGESQKVRVKLCLSFCPNISSVNSHFDAHAIKAQKTIDEIKSAASMQGHTDFDNFKAARMYHYLAERLTANGLVLRIRKFVCKRFDMIPECVSPWGNQIHSTPTPWSTVRFYLESALQEINGNADEAETKYLPGKSIASLLNLPMFIAAFSIRLATKSLELNIWRDNDARPGQKTSKTPTFCKAFGILGACGSQEECLHCLPSLCEKSSSLKATIQTKWECIRRSHWVRLATRLGC